MARSGRSSRSQGGRPDGTAAVYARVSTAIQVDGGTSLPSQLLECRNLAQREGLEVVAEYIDAGESARTDERPQFQALIHDARQGRFSAIITWDNSRFARNREDAVTYKALLKRHGVRLLFVSDPVIEGPIGGLVDSVLEAVAEFYVANLGINTRRGLEETVRQGFFSGGPVLFGYRLEPVTLPGGKTKSRMVPDPLQAEAVRSVYRWYASGMSLRDVAKRLDSTGVVPPRAKGWSPAAVQHLLFQRRDQYLGTFAFGRKPDDGRPEPTVTTQVEPIVDPALAAAVDEAARGRRNIGRFGSEPRLLTGLIRCGNCGSKMMVGSGPSVGRKVGYYRCPGKCGERWIRCEKVEAQVVGELEGYLRGRAFEGLLREMEEQYASRMETFRSERGLAEASLEALTRRRDNLLAALETGAVAPEDVRQRLLDLREKIESTRSTLGKMSDGPRKPVISANILRERIITLLSSGSRRSKRAALSALLERVELKDGRPKLFLALQ